MGCSSACCSLLMFFKTFRLAFALNCPALRGSRGPDHLVLLRAGRIVHARRADRKARGAVKAHGARVLLVDVQRQRGADALGVVQKLPPRAAGLLFRAPSLSPVLYAFLLLRYSWIEANTSSTLRPCTAQASSRDSWMEDGQPTQCMPDCIRT